MPTIFTYPQEDLPLDLKAQIIAILDGEWAGDLDVEARLRRPLHDPDRRPVCVVLREGGSVLGYLAILSTVIRHAGQAYRASGLSAVITNLPYRGRGHGRQLVTAARELIAASPVDLGIFTCDPPLVGFYVQCGWVPMPHTSVVGGTRERPFLADTLGKRTLMGFFSVHAREHRRDFAGAELYLELHEGDLW